MKAGTPLFGGRHKSRKGETKNPVITPFPVSKEGIPVKRIRYPQSSSGFRPALFWEKRKNSFVRVGTLTLRNVLRRMENGFFFYVQIEDRKNLG